MIFMRETTPAAIRRGIVVTSRSTPSMRKRTRRSWSVRADVQVGRALLDGLADELVDEPDDGSVVGRLVQLDDRGVAILGAGSSSPPSRTTSPTRESRAITFAMSSLVVTATRIS